MDSLAADLQRELLEATMPNNDEAASKRNEAMALGAMLTTESLVKLWPLCLISRNISSPEVPKRVGGPRQSNSISRQKES